MWDSLTYSNQNQNEENYMYMLECYQETHVESWISTSF